MLAGAARLAEHPSAISPAFVLRQTGLCFLAAYIFYGAGTVWNDWVDRDVDANVARTKDRPLASGKVTTFQAMLWMVLQTLATWYLLNVMLDGNDLYVLNPLHALMIAVHRIKNGRGTDGCTYRWKHFLPVLVASFLYPFGKRPAARKLYVYPQYILGFIVAWPAVIGWAATYGQHQPFTETVRQCLPLCSMVYFWIIYLNTAYSYQDVADDRKMNVNSFYNLGGQHLHLLLVALASPVPVCMLLFLREFDSFWLWATWLGGWTASFAEQLIHFDPKEPASGGTLHKSNFMLGIWTIFACAVELLRSASKV